MMKFKKFMVLMSAAGLVYGCAPRVEDARLASKSAEARMKGVAWYADGDYPRALARFSEALSMDRASDDRKSEALDLVDIGRVYISVNDAVSARRFLGETVRLSTTEGFHEVLSEAYATLAKVELMENDRPSAMKYIDESIKTDASLSRKESGGKLNLKASIVLSDDRAGEAVALFERALSINESAGDDGEAANSLRGLGDAAFASGDHAGAFRHYEAAYSKDKRLGLSTRIARDLSGMAEAQLVMGRKDEALYLLERSYYVSLSGKDAAFASRSLGRMISILEGSGDIEKARGLKEIKDGLESKENTGETLR